MSPPPPQPQLMDELVEEILLRLPPHSPASLLRAGLVCKRWCHLVSDPGFQRRFREHHRSPPLLGFLIAHVGNGLTYHYTSFVPQPTSGLRHVDHPRLRPRDCRHGRVLLYSNPRYGVVNIVVWDPITGGRVELPNPPPSFLLVPRWTATVLCAAAPSGTCDHLDCHGGPFIVVLLVQHYMDDDLPISSYVYSSESGVWSKPILSLPHSGGAWVCWLHSSQLVGNALYFVPVLRNLTFSFLQYDLGTRKITAINPPKSAHIGVKFELTATKDGLLGYAGVDETKLSVWSREVVGGRWALYQVFDLNKLLPVGSCRPGLYGSAGDTGVIILRVRCRLFSIDIWSGLVTEVDEREPASDNTVVPYIVPYMAFFTPVLSRPPCTDDGPRESAPSARRASLETQVTR